MDRRKKKAAESTAARGGEEAAGDTEIDRCRLSSSPFILVAETPVNALTPAQQRLAVGCGCGPVVQGGEPRQAFIWSSGLIGVPRA